MVSKPNCPRNTKLQAGTPSPVTWLGAACDGPELQALRKLCFGDVPETSGHTPTADTQQGSPAKGPEVKGPASHAGPSTPVGMGWRQDTSPGLSFPSRQMSTVISVLPATSVALLEHQMGRYTWNALQNKNHAVKTGELSRGNQGSHCLANSGETQKIITHTS